MIWFQKLSPQLPTFASWYQGIRARGVLNFPFGMSVRPERPKIGASRMDCRQIWGLKELIFLSNFQVLGTEIWQTFRFKNWTLPRFWGFEMQFSKKKKKKKLWFQVNAGSWGTEKFWNGGLRKRSGGREKGVLRAAGPRISFSGEYTPPPPPPPNQGGCQILCAQISLFSGSLLQDKGELAALYRLQLFQMHFLKSCETHTHI